jgi:Fe-S-cluster containining protein
MTIQRPTPDLPEYLQSQRRLAEDESFTFSCHPGLPCFNTCCHDVNILLTPLDVLQLARTKGMHTQDFLETHTQNPITKELQLPVVMLKMKAEEGKPCPFLGEDGCTVYENRPWACRMYPLGMALPPARAGQPPEPVYFLLEDDFCMGRDQDRQWTPLSWRDDQRVVERDQIEAGYREIVSHPWFIGGRRLDPRRMHMLYTACYDLDSFRSFVFDSTFLERFELSPELVQELRDSDEALLVFAFRWLRFALFGEPTMKVRAEHASNAPKTHLGEGHD